MEVGCKCTTKFSLSKHFGEKSGGKGGIEERGKGVSCLLMRCRAVSSSLPQSVADEVVLHIEEIEEDSREIDGEGQQDDGMAGVP